MFGGFGQSSPFGQSSSSPFGQSLFGQSSGAATSNPFAPKPFGTPTANPFGSQSGGSIFGGTSTGVFGQTPSPLATMPTFGASSSPAFGSSTPAFGASSTPAFGSSLFGQKPAFGGFGSSTTQSNPFGSSFQQTQPTFGSSPFGSTTSFGAPSQPAFGATSTPAFGATSTPAFGATSTPAFGATSTSSFGATTTPSFGATSNPAFGATSTPAFGATSMPAFGATSTPAFGSTTFGSTGTGFGFSSTAAFGSTPAFGSGSSPIFGLSNTPSFGTSSTPAFGASSTPSFTFGSAPAFGQSTPAFGTSTFGTSSFGGQSSAPAFGSTAFGQSTFGQPGGSRVVPYAPTVDTEGASGTQPAGKLESISAMPAYKEKSHEELRWEDYQRGDKGGPNPAGQPTICVGFSAPTQTNPFGQMSAFGQVPANSFPSTSGGLFGQKPAFGPPSIGQSTPAFSSPFGASSTNAFGSSSTTSLFGAPSAPAFSASSTPLFGSSSTPSFGFSSAASATTPAFNAGLSFGNTQSAGLFQSSPATGQMSLFGQPTSVFSQTAASSSLFGGSIFGTSSSLTPCTPIGFSQTTPSFSSPFQSSMPAPTSSGFSFGNFGQMQPASAGFGGVSNFLSQSSAQPSIQANIVFQPAPITNPFGTLPTMPQMSIGQAVAPSSIQYGISSMPVSERPIPVRVSSLLTPRHLSQRRVKLPARKYQPKSDSARVPFFYDEEEASSTPKADALFIPRENPRALVIRPIEQWPSRHIAKKNVFAAVHENGKVPGDAHVSAENGILPNGGAIQSQDSDGHSSPSRSTPKMNGVHDDQTDKGDSSYTVFSGKRAGEAAIAYEHGADIEALMPKLRHPEYYTEPRVQELAAKERAVPGFCRHVKDFVVGRHGYGSIKLEGETDVRRLDLESLVQFNHREVIVYKDESKKPPVGQGLNKPAEVTLLNVKCVDKKTGRQYTEGPKVENYRELLQKKAEEQGAKFVSYDPVKGEWKFKVDHFSRYSFAKAMDSLLGNNISELDDLRVLSV